MPHSSRHPPPALKKPRVPTEGFGQSLQSHPYAHTVYERCMASAATSNRTRRATAAKSGGKASRASRLGRSSYTIAHWPNALWLRQVYPRSSSLTPWAQTMLPNSPPRLIARLDDRAYCGQYSEDGSLFFVASQDMRVRLYRTDGPGLTCCKTMVRDTGVWTITDAALTADNRWLGASSIDPYVYLFKADPDDDTYVRLNLAPRRQQQPSASVYPLFSDDASFGIWSFQFSRDGRHLVAGTSHSHGILHDIETQTNVIQTPLHHDDINAVRYVDASDHVLLSGGDDAALRVWDLRSLRDGQSKPVGVFLGHTEGITHIDAKGDGRYCVSNAKDQTIKLWDIRRMRSAAEVGDRDPAFGLATHWDYRFHAYPRIPGARPHPMDCSVNTYTGHSVLRTLIRCYFSPMHTTGQRYIYSGSADGTVAIYDISGTRAQTLQVDPRRPRRHQWTARGRERSNSDTDDDSGVSQSPASNNTHTELSPDSDLPIAFISEPADHSQDEANGTVRSTLPTVHLYYPRSQTQRRTRPHRDHHASLGMVSDSEPESESEPSDDSDLDASYVPDLDNGMGYRSSTTPASHSHSSRQYRRREAVWRHQGQSDDSESDESNPFEVRDSTVLSVPLGDDQVLEFAIATPHYDFQDRFSMVRDVAWHPFQPTLMAACWARSQGAEGAGEVKEFSYSSTTIL
ncbi:hypothetical protein H4R34_000366 [Dimargaris verticillata]|uniref:WD40-repeat-containing domain protein n=1 Tax=Dimargaris verticillata TaxID=2761393 RepID=A0A9W8BDG1_9FUNG|nr:hypothetical protein H4R34_000366 [Dimargaris verticillata]